MIGVNLQLFDASTQQASLSNIQAMWWDVTEPKDGYRPIGKTSLASTDSNGYIDLDLSNVTGLGIGDYGFLMLYKLDATDHEDSLVFAGKVQTSDITSGVDMYYYDSGWTRPSDWPTLDAIVDGVQKVQGVYAVYDIETAGNAVAITVAGAYHVDWGDGTSADFASGVSAEHTYDYSDTDLGAATSEGFKCAVITITPQSGQNLTSVNFQDRHSTFTQVCTAAWLDIVINGAYITTLTLSASTQIVRLGKLYQFAMGQNAVTSVSNCFRTCYSLQSIPLLDFSSVTNASYCFQNCYSLQSIPLLDFSSVTNASYCFQNCSSLQSIPLLDFSSVTNASYCFQNCYSLQSIPLLDFSAVTSVAYCFQNCYSLQSIPLLDFSAVTNASYCFQYCYSLQYAALYNPRISFSVINCNFGPEALNAIYSNLGTGVTATITVTGNWGVSSDNPSLVPSGWTVTG